MSSTEVEMNIEDALKELQYVSWTNLLNALGIDRTIEVKLFETYRGDRRGGAMRELLQHWMSNYDYSWKELAIALMKIRPYIRNGAYIYNKYVNPECFTPEKIAEEMSFIGDWFEIAHPFLDRSGRVREAVANATTETEKRVSVFKTWIDTYDKPSWEEVAGLIEDVFPHHAEVGKELRKKYLPQVKLMPIKDELKELKTLDEKSLFEETSDVQDWYALGWFLGIPESELLGIENTISRNDMRREEVLKLWLEMKGRDKANWLTLGEAICKIRANLGMGRRLVKRAKKAKEDTIQPDEDLPETNNTIKFDLTAENAAKEIGPIDWKILRDILEIDQSVQDHLDEEYGDSANNEQFVELVLENWLGNRQPSWKALALALMKPQSITKGAYIYNKYMNPNSFTFNKVSETLSIFDILQLSYSLFNDPEKFRKIIKASHMATATGIVNYWLIFGYQPSWEKVAAAIELCYPDKSDLATSIRNKYLPEVTDQDLKMTLKILPLKNLDVVDLESALEATKEVKDWYGLGWFLGMNDKVLSKIEEETANDENKNQRVLQLWLETNKAAASWKTLAEAIRNMPQHHCLSQRILMNYSLIDDVFEQLEDGEDHKMKVEDIQGTPHASTTDSPEPQFNLEDAVDDITDDVGAIQMAVRRIIRDSSDDSIDKAQLAENIKRVDLTLIQLKTKLEDLKQPPRHGMEAEYLRDAATPMKDLSTSIPKNVLDEMEILFKDTVPFTADKPYSFNWEHYGCRLHIPKGSIGDGEEGTVVIYGIHLGPFEVPQGMKLISAIYYITLSHELLKPATLEVLHCCNTIYDKDGECNLTFLTVSDDLTDLKQPYQFTPVNGGQFGSGQEFNQYGFIKRTKFSPYAVAFINWMKYMFGYTVESLEDDENEGAIQQHKPPPPPPLDYAVLYCLIATADQCTWKIALRLMEYLPFNEKLFLRKEKKKSTVVNDTFKKVDLTSDELIIDVSVEDGEPLNWKGGSLKIVDKWEIVSECQGNAVKLRTNEIKRELAPRVEISLFWKGMELDMTTSTFRIHYLGIKEKYNFPVTVPHPYQYRQQLSSTYSSSIEGLECDEQLFDPPDLRTFMKRVAYKAPGDCNGVAMFILSPDGYRHFKATSTSQNLSINDKYELFYDMWEKELGEEEMTWEAIINALEESANRTLAKKLKDCYC